MRYRNPLVVSIATLCVVSSPNPSLIVFASVMTPESIAERS